MARGRVSTGPLVTDSIGALTQQLLSDGVPEYCLPVVSGGTANFNIGCAIKSQADMRKIALALRNVEWRPTGARRNQSTARPGSTFTPALTVTYRNPKATVRLWQSGNASVTGARTAADAKLAARKLCRALQKGASASKLDYAPNLKSVKKLEYATRLVDFRMSNILASARVPVEAGSIFVDLTNLSHLLGPDASFEAELHHTLSWRPLHSCRGLSKMFVLVCSNGKLTFTGFRHVEDILYAYSLMRPWLLQPGVVEILS